MLSTTVTCKDEDEEEVEDEEEDEEEVCIYRVTSSEFWWRKNGYIPIISGIN